MRNAYINIGTNKGDRHRNIEVAVVLIIDMTARVMGINPADVDFALSEIYESEPWGYDSPNRFLNQGMRIALPSDMSPYEILDMLQSAQDSISKDSHRKADGSYADRLIDIDFIALDDVSIVSERLTLPHPRAHQRAFVMQPLIETLPRM